MVRSGKIDEISNAENKFRVVRFTWLADGGAAVESQLKTNPHVSSPMLKESEGVFKFAGSENELAALLQELITGGVRVVSFGEVKQTVEDLYLKLSKNEVM